MQTTVTVKSLPLGMKRALEFMGYAKRDVAIEAKEATYVRGGCSLAYIAANVLVTDIDQPFIVGKRGAFGGNNGYNKPPVKVEDRAWDPVWDETMHDVPVGGCIVTGDIDRHAYVMVHPETFAARFVAHEVARDALLDGRADIAARIVSNENPLTDGQCALLYAHTSYKAGEYRKRIVQRFPEDMEACVARGWIKRARNGACTITTEGKALHDQFRKRGETIAWKI